jgi:hypothetical protein
MSFDRFSSPLESERVNPYFMSLAIEEQRQEIKIDIIREFISAYYSATQELPDLDLIQETYYHLDLDDDVIKKELMNF